MRMIFWGMYLEVDTKQDILEDTGNDQQDVEHGQETIHILGKEREIR